MKSFALGVFLIAALTLVSGIVQGRMSNRWGPSKSIQTAAARLEKLPTNFGDWEMLSTQEMSEDAQNQLECEAYIFRIYKNKRSGETVNMALLLGPAGPIAVHTPEVCYSSRAHKQIAPREYLTLPGASSQEDKFWALTFRATGVNAHLLRVSYAWSTGNKWLASDNPRFSLAGQPYLYKIQLASQLPYFADLSTNDPCKLFLNDFTPMAKQYMMEPSQQ